MKYLSINAARVPLAHQVVTIVGPWWAADCITQVQRLAAVPGSVLDLTMQKSMETQIPYKQVNGHLLEVWANSRAVRPPEPDHE